MKQKWKTDSSATALQSLAGPAWTKLSNTPGCADTMLGVFTSHIYWHHLIPRRAEEALPLHRQLKLILTTLSRNSATKLCALPLPHAGAQVGDTLSREASEEQDLFTAALSITHSWRGPQSPRSHCHEGQRGHAAPSKVTPGSGPPAREGGWCLWVPPGPGERVGAPGVKAALWSLALQPGSEQHWPLSSSLRRAEHKSLPPTGYCYGYRDRAAVGNSVPLFNRRKNSPATKFNRAIKTNTAAYSLNTRYFCNPCPASALSPSLFASVPSPPPDSKPCRAGTAGGTAPPCSGPGSPRGRGGASAAPDGHPHDTGVEPQPWPVAPVQPEAAVHSAGLPGDGAVTRRELLLSAGQGGEGEGGGVEAESGKRGGRPQPLLRPAGREQKCCFAFGFLP